MRQHLRHNLLFGLIGYFGLLKDVNIFSSLSVTSGADLNSARAISKIVSGLLWTVKKIFSFYLYGTEVLSLAWGILITSGLPILLLH